MQRQVDMPAHQNLSGAVAATGPNSAVAKLANDELVRCLAPRLSRLAAQRVAPNTSSASSALREPWARVAPGHGRINQSSLSAPNANQPLNHSTGQGDQ